MARSARETIKLALMALKPLPPVLEKRQLVKLGTGAVRAGPPNSEPARGRSRLLFRLPVRLPRRTPRYYQGGTRSTLSRFPWAF